jgi:uncharacterized protein YerC
MSLTVTRHLVTRTEDEIPSTFDAYRSTSIPSLQPGDLVWFGAGSLEWSIDEVVSVTHHDYNYWTAKFASGYTRTDSDFGFYVQAYRHQTDAQRRAARIAAIPTMASSEAFKAWNANTTVTQVGTIVEVVAGRKVTIGTRGKVIGFTEQPYYGITIVDEDGVTHKTYQRNVRNVNFPAEGYEAFLARVTAEITDSLYAEMEA